MKAVAAVVPCVVAMAAAMSRSAHIAATRPAATAAATSATIEVAHFNQNISDQPGARHLEPVSLECHDVHRKSSRGIRTVGFGIVDSVALLALL